MAIRHLVFTDASIQANTVYIGIYCETLNIKESYSYDINIDICKAEALGIVHAIELTKGINNVFILSDSKDAVNKLSHTYPNLSWVPRELNKQADKLANNINKAIDISTILTKFSLNKRLLLCSKLLKTNITSPSSVYRHSHFGKRLALSLLIKDVSAEERRSLNNGIYGIKDSEWHTLLKGIK